MSQHELNAFDQSHSGVIGQGRLVLQEKSLGFGWIIPKAFFLNNFDPWYFGQGHNYTIIDSPKQGTILTAREVETIHTSWIPEASGI